MVAYIPARNVTVRSLFCLNLAPMLSAGLQLSAAIPVNISYQTSGTSRDPLFSRAQRSMSKMSKRLKA